MDLNPINQISLPVILSVMAIVAMTYLVLRRVFVLPYVAVMEERDGRLEEAEAVLAEADRIVGEAQPEAERIVTEAREKADALLRESREEAETYARNANTTAMEEAGRSLEEGRAKLSDAKANELSALRTEAVECVGLACEQLLGASDQETVEAAVDRLFARRIH